jgi:CubicO group peptidase (beta-lactamase class C family)
MNSRAFAFALIGAIAISNVLSAGAATSDEGPPSEASAVVVPPGQIDQAIRALDGFAKKIMRRSGVPGMAVAVVYDDRIVYVKGFGVRRVGRPARVDAKTVFQLASLSKPVGAAVIAGAVGRGCVKWTDPVAKYLPGFTLADPYVGRTVTIADMYAHRSGLPDHAGDLLEDLGYDRATILHRLALEPLAPFRITYAYTNFGLTAGAQAAAHACKKSWEQLSQDILYGPLGMTATSSRFIDYERASDRADLHVRFGTTWKPLFVREPDAESPAGGVSSSASDMANYMRMELANGSYAGRSVVDKQALLATRDPNLMSSPLASPNSRASFYGLGIGVSYDRAGRLRLSHSGAFALGAATTIVMLPSEHLGIVALTNGMPIGVPEALTAEFLDLAEFGKVQRDWFAAYGPLFEAMSQQHGELAGKTPPSNLLPQRSKDAYVGTYANSYYGDATVASRGGKLVLMLGPHKVAAVLGHWNANTFSYRPMGENGGGNSAVTFTVGRGGSKARSVTVEHLNEEKLGTFVR